MHGSCYIPVVPARGGDDVVLGCTIRSSSSIELACAVRQPGPCVLCANLLRGCCPRTWPVRDPGAMQRQANTFFTLRTALFTLRTSHLHFTLHASSHLKSCELFSTHLTSPHLISSHMSSRQVLLNCFHPIRALINLAHLLKVFLNSSQLFCRQESSYCQREVSCTKNIERRKLLHTEPWDTAAFTQKSLYKILCTTKLAQSTSSTTLCYKACTKRFPVLLSTAKLALCTTNKACTE